MFDKTLCSVPVQKKEIILHFSYVSLWNRITTNVDCFSHACLFLPIFGKNSFSADVAVRHRALFLVNLDVIWHFEKRKKMIEREK